jgi:hypothetical protein
MTKRSAGRIAVAAACAAGVIGATSVLSSASAAPPAGFLSVFDNPNQGGDVRLLTTTVNDVRSIGLNDRRAVQVLDEHGVGRRVDEAGSRRGLGERGLDVAGARPGPRHERPGRRPHRATDPSSRRS